MTQTQSQQSIVDTLNDVLTAELTAINQYFIHSKLCADWGYAQLAKEARSQSIGEMKHADMLMDRILYLKGLPNVQRIGAVRVGETVSEQFKLDLALEQEAIERLNEGIALCRTAGDNGTRVLLEGILASEEEHVDWIETQIQLVESLGEQVYLSRKI